MNKRIASVFSGLLGIGAVLLALSGDTEMGILAMLGACNSLLAGILREMK